MRRGGGATVADSEIRVNSISGQEEEGMSRGERGIGSGIMSTDQANARKKGVHVEYISRLEQIMIYLLYHIYIYC